MMASKWLVEITTPRQDTQKLDEELEVFARNYGVVLDAKYVVSIPDNPMGIPRFKALEVISELGLPIDGARLLVHLNTFHARDDVDSMLQYLADNGLRNLLIVSGDGSERLPKLDPESLGIDAPSVTSVGLLDYVGRKYPGTFHCGVAFNPYEPQDHELEKLRRKIAAGAQFVVTQPTIGKDERVLGLCRFGLPLYVGAWMSKRLELLEKCVGYKLWDGAQAYDPMENLAVLLRECPECGVYLSLLGFKSQLPQIARMLSN